MQVEKRCWPYYHPHQTLPRNIIFLLQVETNLLKKVDASSTCMATCCFNLQERNFNMWQFLRCVQILHVQLRIWTCNATMFRFQVSAICCSILLHSYAVRAFARNVRLRSPDIGSSSTLCILVCISTRLTPNTERLLYLLRTTSVYRRRNRGLHGILTSSLNDLERYQMYSSFIT